MILTEEQAAERLNSPDNLATRIKTISVSNGGKDRLNLSVPERNVVSILARSGEKQTDLARDFGITQGEVSHLKRGKIQGVDKELVEDTVTKVKDKALERLMKSLNLLDDDKLAECSAKDLSAVSANMGRVVSSITPQGRESSPVNVIIYAPETRRAEGYRTIEV